MALPDTSPQPGANETHRLDHVLERMSKLLDELGVACLEVQAAGAELKEVHSADAIIKTQALDRITQSLECLSGFHAELSQMDGIGGLFVGQKEFGAVQLESVRAVLEDRAQSHRQSDFDEIALFDD